MNGEYGRIRLCPSVGLPMGAGCAWALVDGRRVVNPGQPWNDLYDVSIPLLAL